jgi:hypothetical protein
MGAPGPACGLGMSISFLQLVIRNERLEATLNSLASDFRAELNSIHNSLRALPPALASVPWRVGGWTRSQILGHLLDSATNNRQRFVRASIDLTYTGPKYAQEAWVAAHGYADQNWARLLEWWQIEHEILAAIVDRIPEESLRAPCKIGDNEPVTLRYLIEDYLRHQHHHLAQLSAQRSI